MARSVRQEEEVLDLAAHDPRAAARALGVSPTGWTTGRVHVLFDALTVGEALTMAASLRAFGQPEEAHGVLDAVRTQAAGMGGVPTDADNRDPSWDMPSARLRR